MSPIVVTAALALLSVAVLTLFVVFVHPRRRRYKGRHQGSDAAVAAQAREWARRETEERTQRDLADARRQMIRKLTKDTVPTGGEPQ